WPRSRHTQHAPGRAGRSKSPLRRRSHPPAPVERIGEMATPDAVPTSDPTSSAQEFLPVGQWDNVIGGLHGVIFHGVERIKSAQVLTALGCSANKEQEGKRIKSAMRRHGWLGPKVMRFADGSCGSGYWRPWRPVSQVNASD